MYVKTTFKASNARAEEDSLEVTHSQRQLGGKKVTLPTEMGITISLTQKQNPYT